MRARLAVLLGALLLGAGAAAAATRIPLNPGADEAAWKTVSLPDTAEARFTAMPDGVLAIEARGAWGMIHRPLTGIDGRAVLRFRWRVDRAPPATDPAREGGDDRAIALHVWFPLPESERTLWNALGGALEELAGLPGRGRVITYMWGSARPRGASFPNPHFRERGRIVVRRNADAPRGTWLEERIDFAADYRRLFGEPAPAPTSLAISADTDDTGKTSRAALADLRFAPRGPP